MKRPGLPILFSTPMVRALLDDRKTKTRRMAWSKPDPEHDDVFLQSPWQRVPVGTLLYVRETVAFDPCYDHMKPKQITEGRQVYYQTGPCQRIVENWHKKRVAIHMPRWASRITLELVGNHIEPLHAISDSDALAEGVLAASGGVWWVEGLKPETITTLSPVFAYARLWEWINGKGSWDTNTDVVVLAFKVHKMNIDTLLAQRAAA